LISQNWKCSNCGFVAIGLFPPDRCPKCSAPRSSFEHDNEWRFPQEEAEDIINACWKVTYGLYIISSIDGERANGQICNTLFQITSDPPCVAIGINHKNLTHEFIEKSGAFAASILGLNDQRMVRRFGYRSGREFDKFKGVPVIRKRTGCPIYENAIGYLECSMLEGKTVDAGTHSIFLGEIVGGARFRDEDPMTYAYYQETKDRK
jgi:flavin reductase (DIM6/NTAB) family NADH-FMN oxidoreductase RutF